MVPPVIQLLETENQWQTRFHWYHNFLIKYRSGEKFNNSNDNNYTFEWKYLCTVYTLIQLKRHLP